MLDSLQNLPEIILISCDNDLHLCREYFLKNIGKGHTHTHTSPPVVSCEYYLRLCCKQTNQRIICDHSLQPQSMRPGGGGAYLHGSRCQREPFLYATNEEQPLLCTCWGKSQILESESFP